MSIEERLNKLEDAHRSLAAQSDALIAIVRVMLPLIPANPAMVRRVLTGAYDITGEHMDKHCMDDEYQCDVRHWIDVFSGAILTAADKRMHP